jgi:hypothetical protein
MRTLMRRYHRAPSSRLAAAASKAATGLGILALVGIIAALCGGLLGCAAPLATAKTVANGAHASATAAHSVITEVCVPAYQGVRTDADLAEVDATCEPAKRAYLVVRAAWGALVATIVAAEASGGTAVDLGPLTVALGELAAAMRGVSP